MTRVLVVEDEPGIALALETDLALEGYEVQTVSDGRIASQRARGEQFDLILLDLMLPGKDGLAPKQALRETGRPGRA